VDPAADDATLVGRILAGDRAAERELFRRQRARVHATLYRVLGQNRDVEDLIQESFLEVFRSLKGFRGEAKLSTWIDRITVRVAYRYLSTRRPASVPLEMVAEPAADEDTEARTRAREGVRRLYAVLGAMSAHAQLAFTLHVIDGRPLSEVARLVGATGMATKVRVWRARRELGRRAAEDPVLAELLGEHAQDDAAPEGAGKEPA
jgi:RNA polymerase sigma-70 factor (ECF subfamily)